MGVKKKVGKQRLDKFYKLAKETGYRSRAAFKLIQLNRKFSFLEKSRVCVDLCAAPGGWMQVARQNMPVSSIVVGVDLFPIKPIPGCIGLVGDITTDETAKKLEKELQSWKADVVLNDGAPNVGKNWLHDAYDQICLTLSALKVATRFLRAGGWFVTKVFRSKDYNALIWVLKQLFKKVHATKPSASRTESAEIFIVCQGYKAPDRLDQRFLDPKYVFEELELDPKVRISDIMHPEKAKKARAEGYRTGDYTHHSTLTAKEFIFHSNGVEALAGLAEIIFEDDEISKHPKTTTEIRECCSDIKVLGRKDLRAVLAWRKAVREDLIGKIKKGNEENGEKEESDDEKISLIDEDEVELNEISKQIEMLTEEEKAEAKRKRKKANKERQKLQERMNLKMVLKGDIGPVMESDEGFDLKAIKNIKDLKTISDQAPEVLAESEEEEDDTPKPKVELYTKEQSRLDKSGMFYREDESELEESSEEEVADEDLGEDLGLNDSDEEDEENSKMSKAKMKSVKFSDSEKAKKSVKFAISEKTNPLITDLDYRDKKDKRAHKAQLWFEKDTFKNLVSEADEDFELDKLAEEYHRKGGRIIWAEKERGQKRTFDPQDQYSDEESIESDYDVEQSVTEKPNKAEKKKKKEAQQDGFEIVPQGSGSKGKKLKLDEEGLALGALMVSSAKTKRDIVDAGWNKWVFNDPNVPDWFAQDEEKHMKKIMPVPKEMVEEYKRKLQEINVRPIKRVIEAKARKKRRMLRNLEKSKKKLENIMENVDISDKERAKQIRLLYKKAKEKKKEITYVVCKKNGAARKISRPAGVKGPYKVVDPRMKKDNIKRKKAFKQQGKKGKSTKPVNKAQLRRMKQIQKATQRMAVHTT